MSIRADALSDFAVAVAVNPGNVVQLTTDAINQANGDPTLIAAITTVAVTEVPSLAADITAAAIKTAPGSAVAITTAAVSAAPGAATAITTAAVNALGCGLNPNYDVRSTTKTITKPTVDSECGSSSVADVKAASASIIASITTNNSGDGLASGSTPLAAPASESQVLSSAITQNTLVSILNTAIAGCSGNSACITQALTNTQNLAATVLSGAALVAMDSTLQQVASPN